ncbi:MAG: hypothetical protein SFU27_13225 [Thermonemataceae bacterium]|nr:hypothetical protein [Thermonemataceae bacterium]
MEVIFTDETVKISYHYQKAYWLVDFQAYDTCRELYQQVLEDSLSLLRLKPTRKVIFDQTKKSFFREEDIAWAWLYWIPKVAKYLGKEGKLAVILPSKMLWQVEKPVFNLPFQSKTFASLKEAENWINR